MNTQPGRTNADTRKKLAFGVLAVLMLGMVLYLTLQGPKETTQLSGGLKAWLFNTFGWDIDEHTLRSNVHLVEYFGVGLALALFTRSMGWKHWAMAACIAGCAFGLFDETLKIFLPTREFDAVDLVKDWGGVAVASSVVCVLKKERVEKKRR